MNWKKLFGLKSPTKPTVSAKPVVDRTVLELRITRDRSGIFVLRARLDPGYLSLIVWRAKSEGVTPHQIARSDLQLAAEGQPLLGEKLVIDGVLAAVTRAIENGEA